jgi:hypothetical protein
LVVAGFHPHFERMSEPVSDARLVFRLVVGSTLFAKRHLLGALRPAGERFSSRPEEARTYGLIGLFAGAGEVLFRLCSWGARLTSPLAAMAVPWLARWERLGKAEEREASLLTLLALAKVREALFDELGRNSQLKELVRLQSAGLAGSALSEMRSVGEKADAWAERAVRRVLRGIR